MRTGLPEPVLLPRHAEGLRRPVHGAWIMSPQDDSSRPWGYAATRTRLLEGVARKARGYRIIIVHAIGNRSLWRRSLRSMKRVIPAPGSSPEDYQISAFSHSLGGFPTIRFGARISK